MTDLQGKPRVAEVSLGAVDESVYTFGEDRLANLAGFFGDPHAPQRFMPKAWRSSHGDRWDVTKEALDSQQEAIKDLAGHAEMAKSADAAVRELESLRSLTGARPPVPLSALGGELPAASLALARLRTDFRETAVWQPQLRTGADGLLQNILHAARLADAVPPDRRGPDARDGDRHRPDQSAGQSPAGGAAHPAAVRRREGPAPRRRPAPNNTDQERVCWVSWDDRRHADRRSRAAIDEWLDARPSRAEALGRGRSRSRRGRRRASASGWHRAGGDGQGRASAVPTTTRRRRRGAHACRSSRSAGRARCAQRSLPRGRRAGRLQPQQRLTLPAGFVAADLRISLSCADAAQALDGLGYLVDYPYGCVEQTMSRFLPAVMVKQAVAAGAGRACRPTWPPGCPRCWSTG